MWSCPFQKSTIKVPKKIQKDFVKYIDRADAQFAYLDDGGNICTIDDINEHYDSAIMDDLAPFIVHHKLSGEIIYFDSNEGRGGEGFFAKYIFKKGVPYYSEQKQGKKYSKLKKQDRTIDSLLDKVARKALLFEYPLKGRSEHIYYFIKLEKVYDGNDNFMEYRWTKNDKTMVISQDLSSFKKDFKRTLKTSSFNGEVLSMVESVLEDGIDKNWNEELNKSEISILFEWHKSLNPKAWERIIHKKEAEDESIGLDDLIKNPKKIAWKKFMKMFKHHHFHNILSDIPENFQLTDKEYEKMWLDKKGIWILNPEIEFPWSRHNEDGTYSEDVWDDCSWYDWREEFALVGAEDSSGLEIGTFNKFLNLYGFQLVEEEASKFRYKKYNKVFVVSIV